MSSDPEEETLSHPSETPEEPTGDALEGVTSEDINSGDGEVPKLPDEGSTGD